MSSKQVRSIGERAQKAREFHHPKAAGDEAAPVASRLGWTFTLLRPSDLALDESIALNARFGSQVSFQRDQVYAAVIGWTGPKVKDILPDATDGDDPLPFDKTLTPLLLEDRTDLVREIADALVEGYNKRKAERDAAAKN